MVNLIKRRNGWLRIVEATISILIIVGVMVLVSNTNRNTSDQSYNAASKMLGSILDEISKNDSLRLAVLLNNQPSLDVLNSFVSQRISSQSFSYSIKLCSISDACSLNSAPDALTGDIFAQERIISSSSYSPASYSPRKIKIFIWQVN